MSACCNLQYVIFQKYQTLSYICIISNIFYKKIKESLCLAEVMMIMTYRQAEY